MAAIEAGELDATTPMRYRLEGAVGAFDAALGLSSTLKRNLPNAE